MLLWLYKILTHKKLYGYGDYEIINWHSYLLSIKKIFFTNITFSLILFVSICFLFINKASKRLNDISKKQKSLKLLLGVVISQVIAILMIAKHFSGNHYMAINCCLSGLTLVLMVLYLMQINHVFRLNVRNIINYFLFLVIGVIVFRIILIFEINKSFKNIKDESTYIHNRVMTQYPGYDKIYYYRSSSPQFALFFGSVYSNSLFADTLRKIYGAINYYDKLGKEYYTWDKKISMDSLKKKSNNKIIFQGKPLKPEEMPANLKLKAVYKGNWETIYVVE